MQLKQTNSAKNINRESILHGNINRPFPSSPGPLYQNEVKCSAFDMEMIFHSQANKTHFHKKGCALGLILKVRVLELGSGPFIDDSAYITN